MTLKIAEGANIGTPYTDPDPIEPKTIEPETTNLGDVMKGDRWAGDAVNWFYKNFISQFTDSPGKDLYSTLLEPIAGDFNRIKANGDAWNDVSGMLQTLAQNVSTNAKDLTTKDWTGPAANAFFDKIDFQWTPVLEIGRGGCLLLQKAFEKLSDVSVKIATKCANLLESVLEKILKLAAKCIPGSGWIVSLFDWAASGFKDFPYVSDVQEIGHIISTILNLFDSIQRLVDAAKNLMDSYQKVLDAVKEIPNVDTTAGAVKVAEDLKGGVDEAKENKKEFDDAQKDYNTKLDEMTKIGNDADKAG